MGHHRLGKSAVARIAYARSWAGLGDHVHRVAVHSIERPGVGDLDVGLSARWATIGLSGGDTANTRQRYCLVKSLGRQAHHDVRCEAGY